jgi:hypothetical protein
VTNDWCSDTAYERSDIHDVLYWILKALLPRYTEPLITSSDYKQENALFPILVQVALYRYSYCDLIVLMFCCEESSFSNRVVQLPAHK